MHDYEYEAGLSEEEVDDVEHLTQEMQQLAMIVTNDPLAFEEAAKSRVWKDAMKNEIEAIERNGTWELIDLPPGAKKIGVKWIFKTKINEKGEIDKCKTDLWLKDMLNKLVLITLGCLHLLLVGTLFDWFCLLQLVGDGINLMSKVHSYMQK